MELDSDPDKKPDSPSEKRRKKRYKHFLLIIFILVNVAVIFWTGRQEFTRDQSIESVNMPWWLLVPALLSFAIGIFAEIRKYNLLLKHFSGQENLRLARQTVCIGRYYDNITPSAIGGQPMQILHMRKNGIPSATAAMTPVIGFVSTQLAFVLLALITVIFGSHFVLSSAVYAAAFLGVFLYAFFPCLILFFAIKPAVAKKLAVSVLKFLHKIHIVKSVKEAEEKTLGEIEKYATCVKKVFGDKKLILKVMGLSLVYQLGMLSIPFFVITAFGGGIGYVSATMTAISILAAIAFVPTPGNAGVAEGSFYLVFAALPSGSTFWAMLVWRFFTYYIFIAAGALTYLEIGLRKRKEL